MQAQKSRTASGVRLFALKPRRPGWRCRAWPGLEQPEKGFFLRVSMNILLPFVLSLQQPAAISWDLWVSVIAQLPLLAFFLWYIERHDKQFFDRIDSLTKALNCLEKRLAEIGTAEAVADKLAAEFWGRDGKVK